MKASEVNLLTFLKNSPQFTIPIYQRSYSWAEEECRQIWDDIMRAGRDGNIRSHFIGSVVYIQDSIFLSKTQTSLLVIDGQQRLTTLWLLIEALARRVGQEEPVEGFSAKKLRSYYLRNECKEGDAR